MQRVNSYINLATVYRTLDLLRTRPGMTETDMAPAPRTTRHTTAPPPCHLPHVRPSIEFSDDLLETLTNDLRSAIASSPMPTIPSSLAGVRSV